MGLLFIPLYLLVHRSQASISLKVLESVTVFAGNPVTRNSARIGNPNITISCVEWPSHAPIRLWKPRLSARSSKPPLSVRHSIICKESCSLHSSAPHSSSWSFSPSSSLMSPCRYHHSQLSSSKTVTHMHPTHLTSTTNWSLTFPLPLVRREIVQPLIKCSI